MIFKHVSVFLLFLLSFAFPPMMLITIPLLVWRFVSTTRMVRHLRRSHAAYREERLVLDMAAFVKGAKR